MSDFPTETEDILHPNHRDNLRDAALQGGIDSLEDHTLLEILLFNSIPRRNTNDVSHGLLEKFGGLNGIFEADRDAVKRCKKAGESTALFLSVLNDVCNRYSQEFEICDIHFSSVNEAREYICADLKRYGSAVVSVMLLDASRRIKAKVTRSKSEMENCNILSEALKNGTAGRCAFAFVSFNHQNGILAPERDEINFIEDTNRSLLTMGIKLTDAIIVTPSDRRFLSDTEIFAENFFLGQKRPNGQPISEPIS